MTHPKNSNKPSVAQEVLLTDAMPVFLLDVGTPESGLLQVCPGKPAAEALNLSSMLLGSALEILTSLTDRGMSTNEIFGIRFLVESSAALVDASTHSVELGNRQGGAQ
ncbi:hypothetical protein NHF39_28150 [Pseudomonas proteolytica]|nr:hypothetical protein [Pseudomonas proteolytica]USW94986.1 hypothetical protein NHF39_28150 [Pseudomonas proteolytica]USX00982.1 hypothetical protein NHF41_03530 [Pseudomonas proteolytica]